jgi:pseudouridine kinase
LLKKLQESGPKIIIITDGSIGSFGFDGEKYLKLESFPAKLLQKTGAGDAYSVGVLAGLFYGENIDEAMRWGTANSASVVEQMGPQVGLLTLEKIKERLKINKEIVAKEF